MCNEWGGLPFAYNPRSNSSIFDYPFCFETVNNDLKSCFQSTDWANQSPVFYIRMSYIPCPCRMSTVLCPVFDFVPRVPCSCSESYVPSLMSMSRVPSLKSHVHVPSPMFWVLWPCFESHVPNPMSRVPCPESHVSSPMSMSRVSCPKSHVQVSSLVSHVSRLVSMCPCPASPSCHPISLRRDPVLLPRPVLSQCPKSLHSICRSSENSSGSYSSVSPCTAGGLLQS